MPSLLHQLLEKTDTPAFDQNAIRDGVLHVNPAEATQLLEQHTDIKILDVRTGIEFKRGHVKHAENVNYISFSFKKLLSKLDKNVIWLLHCESGNRSSRAMPIMQEAGFESIIHMDGGLDAWQEAGLPVVK